MLLNRFLLLLPKRCGIPASYGASFRLWEGPELDVGLQYAGLITTLSLGLLYAPFYPPMLLISATSVAIQYCAIKTALIKFYRKPPSFNEEMAENLRKVVGHIVLPLYVASYALAHFNAGFEMSHAPIITAISIATAFILADNCLLHRLPGFGDWDQLETSGDTGGMKYDEVQEKTGIEMDFYAYPRINSVDELKAIFHDGHPTRITNEDELLHQEHRESEVSRDALEQDRKRKSSVIRVCSLVSEPWTDHGPGVEDETAPESTRMRAMLGPTNNFLLKCAGYDMIYHAGADGQELQQTESKAKEML